MRAGDGFPSACRAGLGRDVKGRYDCQVDGKAWAGPPMVSRHPEGLILLNADDSRRRSFSRLIVALASMGLVVAACGQPGGSPSESPFGAGGAPADLVDVPQPRLATIDLGSETPGYDGDGSFYSYDSDLSPDATLTAYANQLLRAGFHEADRNGIWRVFLGPRLTVWVRVGSAGPPTSLVIRVEPTVVEVAGGSGSGSRPTATPKAGATGGSGSQSGAGGPKPTAKPVGQQRRPDPPHGTGGATAGGGGGGGTIAGGPASGASSGAGTGSGTSAGSSGGTTAGGAGTGGGGGDFTRP